MRTANRSSAWIVALFLALQIPIALSAQDTLVVRVDESPIWGERSALVEELRIGALDGPPEQVLGAVPSAAVTASGVLAVVDLHVPVVRLYAPDGRYLGDAGRAGEGPEEYRSILGVRAHPSGGLAVWDAGNGRIVRYAADGSFKGGFRVGGGLMTADAFQVDTAGHFYVKVQGQDGTQWLESDAEGRQVARHPSPAPGAEGADLQISAREGPLRPFTIRTHATMSPFGYVISGRNDQYVLAWSDDDGRGVRLEREHRRLGVESEERRQWREWIAFFERGTGRRYPSLPERKPVYHDFRADDDGRLWVRRSVRAVRGPDRLAPAPDRPAFEWREPATYDVIAPDGRWFGTVELPDRRFLASRGDHVWVAEGDELGVTSVVRYRIVPAPTR